jgi:hypothetical protein
LDKYNHSQLVSTHYQKRQEQKAPTLSSQAAPVLRILKGETGSQQAALQRGSVDISQFVDEPYPVSYKVEDRMD